LLLSVKSRGGSPLVTQSGCLAIEAGGQPFLIIGWRRAGQSRLAGEKLLGEVAFQRDLSMAWAARGEGGGAETVGCRLAHQPQENIDWVATRDGPTAVQPVCPSCERGARGRGEWYRISGPRHGAFFTRGIGIAARVSGWCKQGQLVGLKGTAVIFCNLGQAGMRKLSFICEI